MKCACAMTSFLLLLLDWNHLDWTTETDICMYLVLLMNVAPGKPTKFTVCIQARVQNEEECVTSGAYVPDGMVSVCLNLE